MKSIFMGLIGVLLLVGCATRKQVAQSEGTGQRVVFSAPYEQVWRASVDAAQIGDLRIDSADPSSGYIAAHRSPRPHTFGENVGIWVRRISPEETQVEVLSRQAGPPKLWFKNWEKQIITAINANLTRENVGSLPQEPAGAQPLLPTYP